MRKKIQINASFQVKCPIFVYLTNNLLMKTLLTLLCCAFISISSAFSQTSVSPTDIKPLLGCWHEGKSNEWKLGFFEKFAIYDNDFWEYESFSLKNDKAEIALRKGKDSIKLKLVLDSKADSVCTIASSKEGKKKYIRYSAAPDFTSEDHSAFVDNGYKKDSVTIIGYMRNVKRTKPFEVTIPNIYTDEQDSYYTEVDSLGRFRIVVPVINTSQIFMDWQDDGMLISTVIEPGGTFFLFYDYANQDARFMGEGSRLKQELYNYYQSPFVNKQRHPSYDAKMEHDTYLLEHQKSYQGEKDLFEKYLSAHPIVSDKFRTYIMKSQLMSHARYLMQRRFALKRNSEKEQLSEAYMKYVDGIYTQIPLPYTLYGDALDFLRDYLSYYNDFHTFNIAFGELEVLRLLNNEKTHPLTEQQLSDFKAYERVVSASMMAQYYKTDTVQLGKQLAPFGEAALRTSTLLKDSAIIKLVHEYEKIIPELINLKHITDNLISLDSIPMSAFLKELFITQAFYNHLYHEKKALSERSLDYFKNRVSNEDRRKFILDQQAAYVLLANQVLEYPESLKNTDHLKDCKDADQLLHHLIDPYKGKVIYLDFWGTWCAPCKREMGYTPAVKEALKGKDVIFMYLANNSPEDSWKNVIKENHSTGVNVVHYNLPYEQQQILEKHLSIRMFPTFMLIDREGNIVDKNPPAPSRKESLVNKINELLAN